MLDETMPPAAMAAVNLLCSLLAMIFSVAGLCSYSIRNGNCHEFGRNFARRKKIVCSDEPFVKLHLCRFVSPANPVCIAVSWRPEFTEINFDRKVLTRIGGRAIGKSRAAVKVSASRWQTMARLAEEIVIVWASPAV